MLKHSRLRQQPTLTAQLKPETLRVELYRSAFTCYRKCGTSRRLSDYSFSDSRYLFYSPRKKANNGNVKYFYRVQRPNAGIS
jgi:hypothetical protein